MPTTDKVISQVQCQACNQSMSAKKLNYNHAAYCIKRVQEVDKPKARSRPKTIISKLKKTLPVKGAHQDVESDDEEVQIFKGSIIPSDDIELDAMTKLKNQITKAQEEHMINNNKSDLLMYQVNEVSRRQTPVDEVRMNNARQTNKINMISQHPRHFEF